MNALDEFTKFQVPEPIFITVGVFDGVHKGHDYLIKRLVEISALAECASGVLTFRNNPITVVNPELQISYLTNLDDRVTYIKEAGANYVLPVNFDYQLSLMRPLEFLNLLRNSLNLKGLVMGPNFALGHKREGTVSVLKTLAKELNFQISVIDPVEIDGFTVSSTSVRNALLAGEIDLVGKMLGRNYKISGTVVNGDKWGRELGFPTANLSMSSPLLIPKDGVYITLARINGDWLPSATSIGSRPTFDGNEKMVEVHIIDFDRDLYGQVIEVKFLERIRDQIKFESVHDLSLQIGIDVESVRSKFSDPNFIRECD